DDRAAPDRTPLTHNPCHARKSAARHLRQPFRTIPGHDAATRKDRDKSCARLQRVRRFQRRRTPRVTCRRKFSSLLARIITGREGFDHDVVAHERSVATYRRSGAVVTWFRSSLRGLCDRECQMRALAATLIARQI